MVEVAVLIPCLNEGAVIAKVVRDFRAQIPEAKIYVFDNGSTDQTVSEAQAAGAIVRLEPRQGKGYVIRAMFREVDADIYVLVDGDGTYPADQVRELIRPIVNGNADMVIGSRLAASSRSQFPMPRLVGNMLARGMLSGLFHVHVTDLLSGYRAFTKAVVRSLPLFSHGFESETEMTIKAFQRGFQIMEIPVNLAPRVPGSRSKIHFFHDGVAIVGTLFALARDYKPLTVFGLLGLALMGCGSAIGALVLREFLNTGQVLRLPSAIMATGLVLAGMLIMLAGLILHSISRHFQELSCQIQTLLQSGNHDHKFSRTSHALQEDAP